MKRSHVVNITRGCSAEIGKAVKAGADNSDVCNAVEGLHFAVMDRVMRNLPLDDRRLMVKQAEKNSQEFVRHLKKTLRQAEGPWYGIFVRWYFTAVNFAKSTLASVKR